MDDILSIWTVYDHPVDYPYFFIARRGEATSVGFKQTDEVIMSRDLEFLRKRLSARGLEPMARSKEDDPKIVEVWI